MEVKTFDLSNSELVDDIYSQQKESVAKMRASTLSMRDGSISARQSIQDITTMQVYHQIMRIIRYLELMDKLEDKLYSSIDYTIDSSSIDDTKTLVTLLGIQERLQKSMIESHKLLQPYLDLQAFTVVDLTSQQATTVESSNSNIMLMSSEVRDNLRTNAQAVIEQLQLSSGDSA